MPGEERQMSGEEEIGEWMGRDAHGELNGADNKLGEVRWMAN